MLIVDKKKMVEVDLYYKISPTGLRIEVNSVFKDLPEDEKKTFSKLSLKLRPMNWKMYNTLQKDSLVDNGSGTPDTINWVLYKEKKLQAIVAEWDLKDEKGGPVPVTIQAIGDLHPVVPELILREYDSKIMTGE